MRLIFRTIKLCFCSSDAKRQVDFLMRYLRDTSSYQCLRDVSSGEWGAITLNVIDEAFDIGLLNKRQYMSLYREWRANVYVLENKVIGKLFKAFSYIGLGWNK